MSNEVPDTAALVGLTGAAMWGKRHLEGFLVGLLAISSNRLPYLTKAGQEEMSRNSWAVVTELIHSTNDNP